MDEKGGVAQGRSTGANPAWTRRVGSRKVGVQEQTQDTHALDEEKGEVAQGRAGYARAG